MTLFQIELGLLAVSCVLLGYGSALLMLESDGVLSAAIALCAVVTSVQWVAVCRSHDSSVEEG